MPTDHLRSLSEQTVLPPDVRSAIAEELCAREKAERRRKIAEKHLEERAATFARNIFDDYEAAIREVAPSASKDPFTVRQQERKTGGWVVRGTLWSMLLISEHSRWLLVELTVNGKTIYQIKHEDAASLKSTD